MDFNITQGIAVLERAPETLHAMLRDLGPAWTDATEGPESWSPYVIVGHLVHGERANWIPRARVILTQGTDRRFPPFDRLAQFHESQGKSLADLLDRSSARLRAENLATLAAVAVDGHRTRAGWRASGVRHRHAPATVGDLGCARLGTYRTGTARGDGETVPPDAIRPWHGA